MQDWLAPLHQGLPVAQTILLQSCLPCLQMCLLLHVSYSALLCQQLLTAPVTRMRALWRRPAAGKCPLNWPQDAN
jgi:hypothetical protein